MKSIANALTRLEAFLSEKHAGFESDRALADAARRLSVLYTEGGAPPSARAAASAAYLAHFGPRAIASVTYALGACAHVPRHAVDVGAGSGASALALLSAGVQRVTLIERDGASLEMAKALLAPFGSRARFVAGEIDRAPPTDADALVSAFSFGEIAAEPRPAFDSLMRLAPKADTVVLVDAGDHARARRLQTLRDALVLEGRAIAGPCAHTDPCPALVRERDWCHDRIDKHLSVKLARFSELVGRDSAHMSLSWLVVGERTHKDAIIVIGEPFKEKGRVRAPVCGPSGVRFVQALKRHRAAHDALLDMPRGTRLPVALAGTSAGTDTVHVDDPAAFTPS
jgi:ribosomal protein RSM22 (predicted rRNA methylase)